MYLTKNNLLFFKKIDYDADENEIEFQYISNLDTGKIKKIDEIGMILNDFNYNGLLVLSIGAQYGIDLYLYDFETNTRKFLKHFDNKINCNYGSYKNYLICSEDKKVRLDFSDLEPKSKFGFEIENFFVESSINTEIFLYNIVTNELISLNPSKQKILFSEDGVKRTIEVIDNKILVKCNINGNLIRDDVYITSKENKIQMPQTFGQKNIKYTVYKEEIPESWNKWLKPNLNARKSFCGIYNLENKELEKRDDFEQLRKDIDEESLYNFQCASGFCLTGTHKIRTTKKYGEIKYNLGLEEEHLCDNSWYPWIRGGTFIGKINGNYAVWVDTCLTTKEFNELSTRPKTDIWAVKIITS